MSEKELNRSNCADEPDEVLVGRPTSRQSSGGELAPLKRPGSSAETVSLENTGDIPQHDLPRKKSPLPPISDEKIANTNLKGKPEKPGQRENKHPQVVQGYRSEIFAEAECLQEVKSRSSKLISVECQTEWSWLGDLQQIETLKETIQALQALQQQKEAVDVGAASVFSDKDELDADDDGTVKAIQGGAMRTAAKPSEEKVAHGIEFGIPVTPGDSNSESSGESGDENGEWMGSLQGLGPPQILQYIRESELKDFNVKHPDELSPRVIERLGVFNGGCEFCGKEIRELPSLEQQEEQPPEELYCCDEFRQFIQFLMAYPVGDKMIDVSPHAPYGSEEARQAAKERALQRNKALRAGLIALSKSTMKKINRKERRKEGEGKQSQGTQDTHKMRRKSVVPGVRSQDADGEYRLARQISTINYCLSSARCLEEGWTVRPPSPLLEERDEGLEVYEPQCDVMLQPDTQHVKLRGADVVRKFYPSGRNFVLLFTDGSGCVFYPSGRVAISVLPMETSGLHSYIVQSDTDDKTNILAVVEQNGHVTVNYSTGTIRTCIDQLNGIEFDESGARKRKWSWKDQMQHVHAPPIQPLTLAVNQQIALRIMSQENISLTFTAGQRSVRFQAGAHLKFLGPAKTPRIRVDEDQLFRQEIRNRIQEVLLKVDNLIKYPHSPKLDKLPNPPSLQSRQQKTRQLRSLQQREKSSVEEKSEKKPESPVVIVN